MADGSTVLAGDRTTTEAATRLSWLPGAKVLHKELMAHALAWPFLEPVDPIKLNIPTYFQIIERPMDFGTMQGKLHGTSATDVDGDDGMSSAFGGSATYASLEEYKQDLFLVFRNAIKFNADDGRVDSVGNIAKRLRQHALKLLATYFGESSLAWDERMELGVLERQISKAKEQQLRQRWKDQSFVARLNRQKIDKRNEAVMQGSP